MASTLVTTRLSITSFGGASENDSVTIPVGTLLNVQSMNDTEPTPCLVMPPLPLMLNAIEPPSTSICAQLNPQFQIICTACSQWRNFRLRAVYCCVPTLQPMAPPWISRSETKPPGPFSENMPTEVPFLLFIGILNRIFCREQAWATCYCIEFTQVSEERVLFEKRLPNTEAVVQRTCIPVGLNGWPASSVFGGILVISRTKFRI